MVRMINVPLVKPHWLFPITFSFVLLEMASSSIYSVTFPGAEISLAGRSSLDPPSWRWAWHLSLPVLRNHCQAPEPCKNDRAWPHNDMTSSVSALQCGPSSPKHLRCVYPLCCGMSGEVVPDPPLPLWWIFLHFWQTLPLDAGTWEVWQQTLPVETEGNQFLSFSVFSESLLTQLHLI